MARRLEAAEDDAAQNALDALLPLFLAQMTSNFECDSNLVSSPPGGDVDVNPVKPRRRPILSTTSDMSGSSGEGADDSANSLLMENQSPEVNVYLPTKTGLSELGLPLLSTTQEMSCQGMSSERDTCTKTRQQHGWKKEDARSATVTFNLRKRYQHRYAPPSKFHDYHKARQCPIENYNGVISHLSSQLCRQM